MNMEDKSGLIDEIEIVLRDKDGNIKMKKIVKNKIEKTEIFRRDN